MSDTQRPSESITGLVQSPHVMDDCEIRCRSCGTPHDECNTPPWCCKACHHCAACDEHKEPCHAL